MRPSTVAELTSPAQDVAAAFRALRRRAGYAVGDPRAHPGRDLRRHPAGRKPLRGDRPDPAPAARSGERGAEPGRDHLGRERPARGQHQRAAHHERPGRRRGAPPACTSPRPCASWSTGCRWRARRPRTSSRSPRVTSAPSAPRGSRQPSPRSTRPTAAAPRRTRSARRSRRRALRLHGMDCHRTRLRRGAGARGAPASARDGRGGRHRRRAGRAARGDPPRTRAARDAPHRRRRRRRSGWRSPGSSSCCWSASTVGCSTRRASRGRSGTP